MVQSLLQLQKPIQCMSMIIDRQRVDKARNYLVNMAIQNNCDYLLFIDDDNPIPSNTLEKLIEDDRDIVIAPILARNPDKNGEHKICAFNKINVKIKDNILTMYKDIEKFDYEKGFIQKIDAGGCGCMLVKRKVFETLYKKYEGMPFDFVENEVDGQKRRLSEDILFCERAINEGFELWIDLRIKPYHIGENKMIQYKGI